MRKATGNIIALAVSAPSLSTSVVRSSQQSNSWVTSGKELVVQKLASQTRVLLIEHPRYLYAGSPVFARAALPSRETLSSHCFHPKAAPLQERAGLLSPGS
jgi:hypothetical protein